MATIATVEEFLKAFKVKTKTFGMVIYPRSENIDALLIYGINSVQRQEYIMSMTYLNYYKGPRKDNDNPKLPDYLEFGTIVNSCDVYVKLSLGFFSNSTICMSFHPPIRPIIYPLKN